MSDSDDSLLESGVFSNYKPRSCLVPDTNDIDTDSSTDDLLFEAETREYRWGDRHLSEIVEDQLNEDEHQRFFRKYIYYIRKGLGLCFQKISIFIYVY